MVLYFIQQTKINKGTNPHKLTTRKGRVVSTVVSCPYSKYENRVPFFQSPGTPLTSVLEQQKRTNRVKSIARTGESYATHLGTGTSDDSGHLPVELLGGPETAGLVEKRVDLRDRAAIACRD